MKKTFKYILMGLATAVTFTACRPLDKTLDGLGPVQTAVIPPASYTLTLSAADYGILPSTNPAKTSLSFATKDAAATSIPAILASKYPTAVDKSSALVTYGVTNPSIKLADSVNANVAITLQVGPPSDYRWAAFTYKGATVNANNFDDLSATAALNWLRYKNQTPPADYTIRVLTYLYFESNVTASTGTLTTDAFIFTAANDWQKIYCVKPAQYATVNRGVNNAFVTADAANLPGILGTFLKADAAVMATAKTADVIYVNYKYQTSATVSYQRVLPLTFDGNNWVTTPTASAPLQFLKTAGVWVADNTVAYTLTTADMKSIGANQPNVASAAAVANLASFGNYNIQGGATTWTDDQIFNSIAVFLKTKYPTAVVDQKFNITYAAYNGANITAVKNFQFNGTDFVAVYK